METIHIGPCKCGGYGQVYDEKTEKKLGKCHDELPVSEAFHKLRAAWRDLLKEVRKRFRTDVFNILFSTRLLDSGWKVHRVISWRTAIVDHRMNSRQTITFFCFPWEK